MTGIAIVGCGNISQQYLTNLTSFPELNVIACADLDVDRARAVAKEYGVPVAGEVAQVVNHPDVEIVVNLTVPAAHAEVAAEVVATGRHVYNEKPLTLDPASARDLLEAAQAAGVRVGCAPDTFLGAGLQTVARSLAAGDIGTPLSAITLLQGPGPDRWHPSPEFFFKPGAGPLFDMGPYYLTALAVLFGPVTRVAANGSRAHARRRVGSGPLAGTVFDVEVLTHVNALLEFAGGQRATTVFSFDSPLSRGDFLELTGTEATLAAPNPNNFDGPVRLRRTGAPDWTDLPVRGSTAGRGIGVLEMARAIAEGRPHRASGELALHVVEVMTAILTSAEESRFVPVTSTFTPPEPWEAAI
ncbi:Gfo/Idh/MocA family oxidoreductase [Nonomuraea africana]|uniref:Dehydrogenase n=1 Tax=Nonomuraea africana TaxID=46171 RepID=A0ABR9KBP6_9ACTN|nr:Gfo/Idh/MocA family oxidoreductase [Nonomuraea africana]MBE1559430.1 putative dehydrogenase [Nonomuraea africana]